MESNNISDVGVRPNAAQSMPFANYSIPLNILTLLEKEDELAKQIDCTKDLRKREQLLLKQQQILKSIKKQIN